MCRRWPRPRRPWRDRCSTLADLAVPGLVIPSLVEYSSNLTASLIDAAGEKVAMICQAPKSGNIAKVRFTTGTVTTGDTVTVSLQTPNASGDPDGAILGTGNSAYGSQVVLATDDNKSFLVTLTSPCAVTVGQWLAVVIEYSSYVAGNMQIVATAAAYSQAFCIPWLDTYTGTWTRTGGAVVTMFEYDDGSHAPSPAVLPFHLSGSVAIYTAVDADLDPHEYGNLFTVPIAMRAIGWWTSVYSTAGADYEVKLYSKTTADCDTVHTIAIDGDWGRTLTYPIIGRFAEPVSLVTGATHRITMHSTSSTGQRLYYIPVLAVAELDALSWGQNCYGIRKSNAGAWTDINTMRYQIGIIVDQITTAAGGGGSRPVVSYGLEEYH